MSRTDPSKARVTMNISLTPELNRLIEAKVATGQYATASEVLRAGLRLLLEEDRRREIWLNDLREKVRLGAEAADRGEVVDGEEVINGLLRELDDDDRRYGKT